MLSCSPFVAEELFENGGPEAFSKNASAAREECAQLSQRKKMQLYCQL
jgi:hypothetical protein